MRNKGYFMTCWLYIWNTLIKNSVIYRLLCGIYDFLSGKWQESWITNLFRKKYYSDGTAKSSIWGKLCFSPFAMLERLQLKYHERLTAQKEKSGIVRVFNYLLHNILALNIRFIGTLLLSASGTLLVGAIIKNEGFIPWIICCIIGLGLTFINVNLTEFFSSSLIVKLFENMLDTKLSFNFFYITKCGGKARIVWAAILGVLSGIAGVFIHPLLSVVIIGGLFLFALILYKLEFGVYATVFLAPLMPTMLIVGLSLLCFISLIVRALTTKKFTFRTEGIGLMIILMLIIYIISTATSFSVFSSTKILLVYFALMMFYFVVINTVKTQKQLFDLLKLFVLSGLLVCAYGIFQYLFGWNLETSWVDQDMFGDIKMRIYSTLENPNVLGEFILLVLPLSIAMILISKKPFSKLVFAGFSAVMAVALVLTFSRGCWLGFMASIAIFITFATGKLWGLALITLPLAPFILPESIINRFTSIGNVSDSSTSYRVSIWLGTISMLKDYWISGIGLGTDAFTQVYPFYAHNLVVAQHPHNLFLNIISESGIIGLVLFILLVFIFIKKLITGHHYLGKGHALSTVMVAIGAALIGFLIQGMFDNSFYNYRVFMLFWAFLSFGISARYLAKDEAQNKDS